MAGKGTYPISKLFLAILFLMLPSLLFAGEVATGGGNITAVNLELSAGNTTWYASCGQASSEPVSTLSITAVPGNVSCRTINTGSASCSAGPSMVNLIFSNSSFAITSLSAGSLSALDSFIGSHGFQDAAGTFSSSTAFNTSAYGTLSSVPTAYAYPAASQKFRTGYLQDQGGNIVFLAPVSYNQTGFNGSLMDFEALLPTRDNAATTYYVTVDLSCNPSSSQEQPSGGGQQPSTVSPSLVSFPFPPQVSIPSEPPSASQILVMRLSTFREVLAGDRIILNPLIENPTSEDVEISLRISGAGSSLSQPVENVLLAASDKKTIPLAVRVPTELKDGYYSLVLTVSAGDSEVSYPTILHVLPSFQSDQPVLRRHFSLDYEKGETLVSLTVTNSGGKHLPYLQVQESVPSALLEQAGVSSVSAEPGSFGEQGSAEVDGGEISWSLENLAPSSSRTLVYKIPVLLRDASSYAAWNLASLSMVEPASNREILIRDLQAPSLLPGEAGEIFMKLFNAGAVRRDVELDILGPQGWKLSPRSLSTTINSRDSNAISIQVQPPADAAAGTYGLTVRMKYLDTIFDRQVFIYVYAPTSEIFAPPITDQMAAWMGAHAATIAAFVIGAALAGGMAYAAIRRLSLPRYSQERVDDLRVLERLYKDSGKPK